MKSVHSDKFQRFIGHDEAERISNSMLNWYGPPIPVANIPGKVFAVRGGEFVGKIDGGEFTNLVDRHVTRAFSVVKKLGRTKHGILHAGFGSLGDLIAEMTVNAKRKDFLFLKSGNTGVVGATNTLWNVGSQPVAGAVGGAAPGGTAHVDSDTGAFTFVNPTSGDTQHLTHASIITSVAGQTLLMYDRLFSVTKTMNSTATEAVTGTPSRYQNTSITAADSIEGNFVFPECTTALAATAHNWTVCQYTDQAGNTGNSIPSVTGNSGNIISRLDIPTGQFFMPLASGDTGIKNLTQMQCSAAVATGAISFVIGHPLAFMPVPALNILAVYDGLSTAYGLQRIFDDACIAFLELAKSATTATTYTGQFSTAAG